MNNPAPQTPATATPAADPVKPTTYAPTKDKDKDITATAPTAAKGNDDVMSQPAKKS